jgi:GxxExxY protein
MAEPLPSLDGWSSLMSDQPTHVEQRDPETYAVLGAAMAVHRNLGAGFLEAVYQEALALELGARLIPFQREAPLTIIYRGIHLACRYRVDFICFGEIIVELKAQQHVSSIEEAQVLNYLRASRLHRALLINFGQKSLVFRRFSCLPMTAGPA